MQEVVKTLKSRTGIPIVFAFNILKNYHKEFGVQHYLPIKNFIQSFGYKIELFPIINLQHGGSIEKRADYIKEHLPEVLEKLGTKQCNILSFSASGLDFRYYISSLGGHENINALATISCPHRGSFLADSYTMKRIFDDEVDPITRLVGISQSSFRELCTSNIDDFNAVTHNHEKVKYYSFSSYRDHSIVSDLFRHSQDFIRSNRQRGIPTDNDGVFTSDETVWGNHLQTLVADHAELVGLRIGYNPESIYRSILDKTRF